MKALLCNGSRVLTPSEASAMRAVIGKPSNRALFDLLLYTGLRLSEVRQVSRENFDQDRHVLTIRSGKATATQACRNVLLSPRGVEAVQAYLEAPKVPASPTAWQMNLIRWARQAGLSPLPGHQEDQGGNPYGITVRTTRKSLESWILEAFPARHAAVCLSQGHSSQVSLRHYLNCAWSPEEREAIRAETAGWGE